MTSPTIIPAGPGFMLVSWSHPTRDTPEGWSWRCPIVAWRITDNAEEAFAEPITVSWHLNGAVKGSGGHMGIMGPDGTVHEPGGEAMWETEEEFLADCRTCTLCREDA